MRRSIAFVLVVVLGAAAVVSPAFAHVTGRAFVLLLPTHLYAWGGAFTVALSFVVMALIPVTGLQAARGGRLQLGYLPREPGVGLSLLSLAAVICLVVAGYIGDRDPLSNPLPTVIWTLWWVGFTLLHALCGNLWATINPWRGLHWLVLALLRRGFSQREPLLAYPKAIGFLPAIALFFAFAWFELVYDAPQDPSILATAIIVYAAITLAGMVAFGARDWLRYGEAFAVFFRVVSWLSPLAAQPVGSDRDGSRRRLALSVPGAGLLEIGALRLSGVVFVLLALSSVSFDGLSRTFWWVALAGENPLEFSGRSAVLGINTFGLFATFVALLGVYVVAVLAGRRLAGSREGVVESLGRYVVAIVPIAFGYHFAHYLPALIVDGQYGVRAISDPFALGWDLFGTADMHVHAALLTNHASVRLVYNLQVAGIVLVHVMAVVIAHFLALRQTDSPRRAILSQVPMTALMIGYTIFGLWLLSSPTIG